MSLSAQSADGRQVGKLTRTDITEALQEYARTYGVNFGSAAFNPATARWAGREDLMERYYAGRSDGSAWPSLNAIKSLFNGSFTAARTAAGLPQNKPGPRRGRGEAAPIRDVRVQRVTVESDRDRELSVKLDRARDREARLRDRLEQAEAQLRDRREVVRERVVREPAVVKTKTKVKTVVKRVRDDRVEQRLRDKLADESASRRAVDDQLKKAVADRDEARRLADVRARELAVACADAKNYQVEAKRVADRLRVAEERVDRLRGELSYAEMADADARERAVVADLVSKADSRADAAELRAARAEREMVEQAAAVTGEQRKFTKNELEMLRANGPAGPAVVAAALKSLARARSGHGELGDALTELARAALTWKDRLK